jgi:hypothetical protein
MYPTVHNLPTQRRPWPAGIIVTSLDNVLAALVERPLGAAQRGSIPFNHECSHSRGRCPHLADDLRALREFDH